MACGPGFLSVVGFVLLLGAGAIQVIAVSGSPWFRVSNLGGDSKLHKNVVGYGLFQICSHYTLSEDSVTFDGSMCASLTDFLDRDGYWCASNTGQLGPTLKSLIGPIRNSFCTLLVAAHPAMSTEIDVKTYSDDKCLGQVAPSLESLEFVVGDKTDLVKGKVNVLFFWVSYYKGAWLINEELTQLSEKYPEVEFFAISNDADRAAVEKFLKKIEDGRVIDENTKATYRLGVSRVAYDDKKAVGKAYADLSNNSLVHVPQAFIVDKDGKIVWRQNLTQSFTMAMSNFADQLERVLKGEALDMSNGPKPVVAADEGEEADIDADMSLF